MSENWGHKWTISIYVKGDASAIEVDRMTTLSGVTMDRWLCEYYGLPVDFIGLSLEEIKDKPIDQIAT